MLSYLGAGTRNYGINPHIIVQRPFWEFQAVVDGKIGMTFNDAILNGPLLQYTLWLSAPTCEHGWTGDGNHPSEVLVFHFPYVNELLQNLMPDQGWLSIDLDEHQITRLKELAKRGTDNLRKPSFVSQLYFQSILTGLSILFLEGLNLDTIAPSASHAREVVDKALAWYSANLHDAPTLDDVGLAVSTSPAHLRRIFHQSTNMSPKAALDQLRFQRAHDLMEDPNNTLEYISEMTGFMSASSFSRAFKVRYGMSPKQWRHHIH